MWRDTQVMMVYIWRALDMFLPGRCHQQHLQTSLSVQNFVKVLLCFFLLCWWISTNMGYFQSTFNHVMSQTVDFINFNTYRASFRLVPPHFSLTKLSTKSVINISINTCNLLFIIPYAFSTTLLMKPNRNQLGLWPFFYSIRDAQ